jgi:hypothetical protein
VLVDERRGPIQANLRSGLFDPGRQAEIGKVIDRIRGVLELPSELKAVRDTSLLLGQPAA